MGWNLGTWDAPAPAILGQSIKSPLEWEFGAREISGEGTGSPQPWETNYWWLTRPKLLRDHLAKDQHL